MAILVLGSAITAVSVVRHATATGEAVVVVEDRPSAIADWPDRAARLEGEGATVVAAPDADALAAMVARSDLLVPSPGVPERHPAIVAALARGIPVRSEIELAARLAAARTDAPTLVAVTGTNGKTTVTTLTTAMLEASGVRTVAAGNIGVPLLDAVAEGHDVVVAEVSSFQLRFTDQFRPRAAALLNLGEDHLDWHRTFDAYAQAKRNVFAHQGPDDVVVFNADDPVVAGLVADAPGRRIPFSIAAGAAAGARIVETATGRILVSADDIELVAVDEMERSRPVDLANALAAAALALETGATVGAIGETLRAFRGIAHRMSLVVEADGVRWIDDSKATNVHAALAAAQGIDSLVLIAGGQNKGLDLTALGVLTPRLRGVVAIGDAADEVAAAFADTHVPVQVATTMGDAVRSARAMARSGDTVLLSPGCASFDWYSSYAARGDDFACEVRAMERSAR
ncbi:MAG TPA: UDP-N-acetylmuramoyl-L-alanine--D-glutamate ligase [Acidimicrobiia bacterium]|nr:UDP-N-acetylmuramoyl-L-alanine--D-glutamate ligase [Acidimicrobiia bacterium]